jgi:hypothetical protein
MKTNLFKNSGKFAVITSLSATTVIVAVIVTNYHYYSEYRESAIRHSSNILADSTPENALVSARNRKIKPPIKDADVPYKSFHYKAEKGTTLSYGNSKIQIPANSLIDKNGNLVKGDVEVQYREFHTPFDFFVSGIPMSYDSGGKQYTFESDGMFDIKGFKGGEPVFIKQGKQWQMDIASLNGKESYNYYRLDTLSGKWALLQSGVKTKPVQLWQPVQPPIPKDTIVAENKKTTELCEEVEETKQAEKKIEEDEPFKPQKAGPAKCYVSIDCDSNEYPELAMYRGLWFAVDLHDTVFKKQYTENYKTWENMKFKRVDKGETYQATVYSGNESHTFLLHPVFSPAGYETAMVIYNNKYREYENLLNEKKEEERIKEEAYQALLKKQEEEKKKQEEVYQAQLKKQAYEKFNKDLKTDLSSAVSFYCLTIKSFGTYNCDSPNSRPQGAMMAATYSDNKKEDLNSQIIYLVEKGKNILNSYSLGQKFCFNPQSVNFAWCVTPDNHIAVFTDADFKKINPADTTFNFVLQKTQKKFKSEEELDTFFKQYM